MRIAIIGARGIQPGYKKPKVYVSIPGYEHGERERTTNPIELDEDSSTQNVDSFNDPNFLQFAEFNNIDLPVKPLYLPVVNIDIKDTGFMGSSCFT